MRRRAASRRRRAATDSSLPSCVMSSAFQRSVFFGVHFTIRAGKKSNCISRAPSPALLTAPRGRHRLGALGFPPYSPSERSDGPQVAAPCPRFGAHINPRTSIHASGPSTGVGTMQGGLLELLLIHRRLAWGVRHCARKVAASSHIPSPRHVGLLLLPRSVPPLAVSTFCTSLVRVSLLHRRCPD